MKKPIRGPQVAPTQERRRELTKMLDEMASAGDANSAGWLLALHELRKIRSFPQCQNQK